MTTQYFNLLMRRYLFSFIIFACITVKSSATEGHKINVRIKNLANKELILGYHFADKLYPSDTLKLDNKGEGTIIGSTQYPEGLYFFMTPSHNMFDFFMTEKQHFSIENDTTNLYDNLVFKDSPENTAALEYRKDLSKKQKETNELIDSKKNIQDKKELKKIDDQIKQISVYLKTQSNNLINSQKDNFVGKFIKSTQEIEVPDPPKNNDGKIIDSLFQYRYYRNHYFDNLDLSDARFLRTPIYDEKIKRYIEKAIPQIPDTINLECDKLLTIAEKDKEIFRYMLITLFNNYATSQIMGFDAVYAHIAEKWYIPKATFSDTAFIRQTKETVASLKPLLLGKKAPAMQMVWVPSEHFIQAKTDTIARNNPYIGSYIDFYNIDSKYTILAFWESDCSHCKKSIPELYEVYQRLKPKGVSVLAIHMLGGVEGKKKWINFVNEHELYNWINAWNPYDFTYKKLYDIKTTPVIFILDKDKKIIGKKLDPKQIEEFINALIAAEEKKKS